MPVFTIHWVYLATISPIERDRIETARVLELAGVSALQSVPLVTCTPLLELRKTKEWFRLSYNGDGQTAVPKTDKKFIAITAGDYHTLGV